MNRREAMAALMALPATARVSVAQLKPDDVIIIECDQHLNDQQIEFIKARVGEVWPDRKIAVFTAGLKFKIATG